MKYNECARHLFSACSVGVWWYGGDIAGMVVGTGMVAAAHRWPVTLMGAVKI